MKNTLLISTGSHFNKQDVCKQIKVGVNTKLVLCACHKRINKEQDFCAWRHGMKHLDDMLAADCAELQLMLAKAHEGSHCDNTLTEPSCHANVPTTTDSDKPHNGIPKLMDAE